MALPNNRADREFQRFRDSGTPGQTRVAVVPEGSFSVPAEADAFTVELANSDLDVVYKFRTGGVAGTVISTVTLTYASTQTLDLVSGVIV